PDSLRDGNPIFSAFSPTLRRGVRVIQHPPTLNTLEFEFWLDTFGGRLIDPASIYELVIACALSTEVRTRPIALIQPWEYGQQIRIEFDEPEILAAPLIRQPSRLDLPGTAHTVYEKDV